MKNKNLIENFLNGKISLKNMKGSNREYALRCNPNAKKGKALKLWDELLKYETTYAPENF